MLILATRSIETDRTSGYNILWAVFALMYGSSITARNRTDGHQVDRYRLVRGPGSSGSQGKLTRAVLRVIIELTRLQELRVFHYITSMITLTAAVSYYAMATRSGTVFKEIGKDHCALDSVRVREHDG